MIRNLIFDWGGVILTLDKEKCLNAFDVVAGVPNFSEYLTPYLQKGFFAAYENGDIDDAEFCRCVRELSVKENVTDDDVKNALYQFLEEIPQYKVNMLLTLKEKYNLYVLSNNNNICWERSARMFENICGKSVDEVFDYCFLSFRLNRMKPGKEIYEEVITRGGLVPQESLFIDDAPANIEAAEKLGFKTLYYDINKNLEEELLNCLNRENG